ncbi:hypothetical protein L345_02819 [Ophiophagus hannah]|uniref:Uncharacterized protein n=1 Tax=Ophiophagus hannah TaxID=8665 RepID=V8P9Y6_OPHHA|nr:hypothetical protein L345_02819 [Ophiophagus hannah]
MGKIGELPRMLSLFVFLKGRRLLFVRLLLSSGAFYKRQDLLKMSWVEIKTAYNLEDLAGKDVLVWETEENTKPSIFAYNSSKVHVMENKVMKRWDGEQVGKVGCAVHSSSDREGQLKYKGFYQINKTSNLLHAKMGSDLPWFTSITGFTTRNLVSINHSAILTALIHKNITLQFMIEGNEAELAEAQGSLLSLSEAWQWTEDLVPSTKATNKRLRGFPAARLRSAAPAE